ncbi:MAG: hypothetical protein LBJ11_05640 [Oscillospiraceae bacterium]|nr:hypothetical protein [Oscillospiraceae bacterium]
MDKEMLEKITEMFPDMESDAREKLLELLSQREPEFKFKPRLFSLLLCKASFHNEKYLNCFDPETEEDKARIRWHRSFASLGSTADSIQMHELEPKGGNLLKAVFEENDFVSTRLDGTVFVNPQYIVFSAADSREAGYYGEFWAEAAPDNFFFTTAVNMEEPATDFAKRQEFRGELIKAIRKSQKKFGDSFRFLICNSLDLLQDFTILWRSKNIRPVIETLRDVCEALLPNFARKQTICSVPADRLLDGEKFEGLMESAGKDICIDNMTMRAVSSDYGKLLELQKSLTELEGQAHLDIAEHCFVLGNTDCIVFLKGLTDRNICMLMKKILEQIQKRAVGDALLRLETSIGIEMSTSVVSRSLRPRENALKLNRAAEWLLNGRDGVEGIKNLLEQPVFNGDSAPWASSLLELCNMIAHMSRSCIYDNASFLLLDSMYLFHAWLSQVIVGSGGTYALSEQKEEGQGRKRLAMETERVNRYINGMIQLMDMITRSGGTIAHMPGFSPLQYHLTSSVVEFTQAFFIKVSRFLRDCTEEKDDTISCILVPTQCPRIQTEELFWGEVAIDGEPKKVLDRSMLVYIEVPMELLSRPLAIAIALTHESGHHYGQAQISLRMRRNECFAKALGRILGDAIGSNEGEASAIEDELVQAIKARDKEHQRHLPVELSSATLETERRWDEHLRICEECATEVLLEHADNEKVAHQVHPLLGGGRNNPITLHDYVKELYNLFRESVCDVFMLILLHETCDAKDLAIYIHSFFMNEAELTRCSGELEDRFSSIIMRIYAVRQVIQRSFTKISPGAIDEKSGKRRTYEYMLEQDDTLEQDADKYKKDAKRERIDPQALPIDAIVKEIKALPDYHPGNSEAEHFLGVLEEDLHYLDQRGEGKITPTKQCYHSDVTLEDLIAYLSDCKFSILEKIEGEGKGDQKCQELKEELADIRRAYQAFVNNEFFGRSFYDLVHEHREAVLNQINENGSPKTEFVFSPSD